MPNISQQDIAHQPATKGYSFSTNPSSPEIEERKKRNNAIVLLLLEIVGLIAVFVVILLILNFFNILSLSKIYPKQLGFLPHLRQTANTQRTPQTQTTGVTSGNQAPVLASFAKLQNQAPDTKVKKYLNSATGFTKPAISGNSTNYVSDAVFSGYDSHSIQVVTAEGVLNLSFDQNTLFQKQPAPKTPAGGSTSSAAELPAVVPYASPTDFFQNVAFGSDLQVLFSKPDLKAIRINYIESIKPVL
jgi:hypothetical protein